MSETIRSVWAPQFKNRTAHDGQPCTNGIWQSSYSLLLHDSKAAAKVVSGDDVIDEMELE